MSIGKDYLLLRSLRYAQLQPAAAKPDTHAADMRASCRRRRSTDRQPRRTHTAACAHTDPALCLLVPCSGARATAYSSLASYRVEQPGWRTQPPTQLPQVRTCHTKPSFTLFGIGSGDYLQSHQQCPH